VHAPPFSRLRLLGTALRTAPPFNSGPYSLNHCSDPRDPWKSDHGHVHRTGAWIPVAPTPRFRSSSRRIGGLHRSRTRLACLCRKTPVSICLHQYLVVLRYGSNRDHSMQKWGDYRASMYCIESASSYVDSIRRPCIPVFSRGTSLSSPLVCAAIVC
jgi:hypothetical protein